MACLKICVFICLVLAVFSDSAFSAVEIVLAPAREEAGEAGILLVAAYFMNQGDETAPLEAPRNVACLLKLEKGGHEATMEAVGDGYPPPPSLAPGGFYRQVYQIRLPEGADGTVRIIPTGLDAPEILLAVAEEEDQGQPAILPEETAAVEESSPLSYVVSNLATYKPMYFLYGGDPADTKFQLSFKYRLFNPEGNWAQSQPWLSGFHIAYTQTSWWDMGALSKPFKDSSYMPEIFWATDDLGLSYPGWIDGLGIQVGAQHESNGKGGDDSRSLNIAYVEPIVRFPLPWDFYLTLAPKVWTYIFDLSDNPDIADYRGYFDFRLTIGQDHGLQLTTNLRKGTDWGKGSIQLDLTYPLAQLSGDNLGLYLQAQFFDGYAESLIDYNKAHTAFRLGLGLSRW